MATTDQRLPDAPPTTRRRGLRPRALWRELRSWPTVLLLVVCLLGGLPTAIALTPAQDVTILGQHVELGARVPTPTLSGPAQLVQIGNTRLDITPLQVWGPMRPQLTLGPVQRNAAAAEVLDPDRTAAARAQATDTLVGGFVRWYAFGALGMVGLCLAICAVAGCARMLALLRRQSRAHEGHITVAELWHRSAGTVGRTTVLAVAVSLLAWGACGWFAWSGATRGLSDVRSLTQLVGSYHLSPSPVGPAVSGYTGAVIGDSRAARVGGPPVPEATSDDIACERSADSLAAELGAVTATSVRNLACSGATIAQGLRGPQARGPSSVPAQVSLLKQMTGLRYVVVEIGPNDLGWSDFLTYCYGVPDCADRFTAGEFDYRLAAFDRDYGDLLQDLAALPDRPQIVIMTSYDVFAPGTDPGACPDGRGPAGVPGLDAAKTELMHERNQALNDVLRAGAAKYDMTVVDPPLEPLCSPGAADGLGPDLQGLADRYPFHPTGVGSLRVAAATARLLDLDERPS
ncbi:GDSL-type esterase/lipase family protein [Pseudonocardia dioxanivorans]|uniref:GDSL-type esterase/lipase family protein n=1 Tax=Pseudonocardia dioxanivorans TaxID=240495 RepID=UPI000CD2EB90|nr:GDSL-type esterase/lipase family protein [Pseudonocardia dioxanivorans]